MLKGTTVVPVPSLGVLKLLLVVTGMVEGVVVVMVVWVTLSLLRSASVKLSSVALPSVTCTPGTVIGTQLKHTRKAIFFCGIQIVCTVYDKYRNNILREVFEQSYTIHSHCVNS